MKITDKPLSVRQSNELIEASYKIPSIGEGRLIRMLIAQIQPSDEDFKSYRISVSDFAQMFGLSGNSVHEQIEKSARGLRDREIIIRKGKSWFATGWLSHAEYIEGTGYIEISFHAKLKPYLLQLKTHFTQYELEKIVTFKSGYSMRLFELLKTEQFKAVTNGYFRRSFEYEELREKLAIGKGEYKLFADFRVNVVQTATREINANPDLHITQVDYPKTGRKVSHVVFHCEKAKQTQLDLEPSPTLEEVPKEEPEYIRELVTLGIDQATAYKWRKKYGMRQLVRNIAYTQAMRKAGKIRDSVTGFLARAIADNLGGQWEEEEKKREKERKAREKVEQDKAREETRIAEEQAQKYTSIETAFDSLSKDEKEAIRLAFELQIPDFLRKYWDQGKAKNGTPEKVPTIRAQFLKFFASTRHDE
jgi:plasmid replication initiation protein